MGMILMPGGGGGIDLDVVTATAGDILSGKVIVGADGEPLTGILALSGNAGTGDVLSAKTFYSNDAKTKLAGTMTNQGAKTASINCGGSYTIPAGYHNGSGKVTANSLSSQTSGTATAENILTGKTAWVNGSKISGTMKNYSSSIQIATTDASDKTKSCYRKNGENLEIVPAAGYWGEWNWAVSCIRVPLSAMCSIKSGSVYCSTKESTTINGDTRDRTAVIFNPGGTPVLAFAYRTDHNDCSAISNNGLKFANTGGRNYFVTSSHIFNSSSVHIPTNTTDNATWNYWCVIY